MAIVDASGVAAVELVGLHEAAFVVEAANRVPVGGLLVNQLTACRCFALDSNHGGILRAATRGYSFKLGKLSRRFLQLYGRLDWWAKGEVLRSCNVGRLSSSLLVRAFVSEGECVGVTHLFDVARDGHLSLLRLFLLLGTVGHHETLFSVQGLPTTGRALCVLGLYRATPRLDLAVPVRTHLCVGRIMCKLGQT